VVIGTVDSNIKVAGKGIKRLQEAGANVIIGILEKDCYELNQRFFTFHEKKRPYIILKWAETQDGFTAPLQKEEQKPVWITNINSRQLVHKWRTEEQAILVGTQTVIDDNPQLNARDWEGNNPIRIVIDQRNRIPKTAHVFDNQTKTIVFSNKKSAPSLENTIFEVIDFQQNIAQQIIDKLYQHQIQSVIIEGGAQTLQTFIDATLWDEARVFIGNSTFGTGKKAPILNTTLSTKEKIGTDELLIIRNYD
jgi:diaminohydroxyphosphoribosylaminopyrimidine deaminase/5-amino-6-(5-phosphoribosylamino)uracil reductase